MNDRFDSVEQAGGTAPASPLTEAIIPSGEGAAAQRELYGALMQGLAGEERDDLEHLMVDNIDRLRSDGDSYAP